MAIHGYFSFGRAETCCPSPSVPTSRNSDYIVAPFETSIAIDDGNGSVSYEVHNISSHSSLLGQVNKFIRQTGLKQSTFAGTWMLVAEWKNVSQPGYLMSRLVYESLLNVE
ncbi:MAG: hypothetical protein MJE68_28955 [Proteobacteria bacterium]|nr:hypothetical protein [Pseudomonadota bacterium]